mgnify:FL=1
MIKLKIKVHGHLYWYAGKKWELELEVKPEPIEKILEEIGIPLGEVSFVAKDSKKVELEYLPMDGDTLDVYPVVGGG